MAIEADLAIVGGGPAATGVLAALATVRPAWRGRIVVLERGASLGPGLPYGEAADPKHTYGRVPVRRRAKGDALRAQASRAIASLERGGASVIAMTGTAARRLVATTSGWDIETDRDRIAATRTVLASGHWNVQNLRGPRVVDWRWDVRRLDVADDQDLVVLGTSQSAIDVAIALGERPNRTGKVILASRRGLLPAVWGPTGLSPATRRGAPHLEALCGRAGVRLADVLAAIRRDIAELGGAPGSIGDHASSGPALLRADLAAAKRARRDRREIAWQAAVWRSMPPAFDIFPRLPAEDRLALAAGWPIALRYLEAIHVANAARVLALIEAGRVEVRALGWAPVVVEDATGVAVGGPAGEVRGHAILDARGPDPDIARSDDAFLHSVLATGRAVPARVPFADGRAHLVTGGLWLDLATFRVRDDAGTTSSLYALGALAQGQLPTYLGLWGIRRAAARIAAHLAST